MPVSFIRKQRDVAKVGVGISSAHHGELFQGEIEDRFGRLRRCLVSLPCPHLWARATFLPDPGSRLVVQPCDRWKTLAAARLALARCGAPDLGGVIAVTNNIVDAKGYGSSTSDCVAAVHAVADALDRPLMPVDVARIVVDAEAASDNVMFPNPVLFAQREGVVLEDFRRPLPPFEVVGVDTQCDRVVDTLDYPPASYTCAEVEVFSALLGAIRRAIRLSDATLLARVATASALMNERFLPKPLFRDLHAVARECGALGIAVAHSGTLLSFLLDSSDPALDTRVEQIQTRLSVLGLEDIMRFNLATAGVAVKAS